MPCNRYLRMCLVCGLDEPSQNCVCSPSSRISHMVVLYFEISLLLKRKDGCYNDIAGFSLNMLVHGHMQLLVVSPVISYINFLATTFLYTLVGDM